MNLVTQTECTNLLFAVPNFTHHLCENSNGWGVNMTRYLIFALAITFASPALADGDPAAGEKTFKKCKACHVVDSDKNRVGPSLKGVVGRAAGAVDGYKYSKAMVDFGKGGAVWDDATLDA